MSRRSSFRPITLFPVAAALVLGLAAADSPPADSRAPCVAAFRPDTVRAGIEPVSVGYTLSETVGALSNVTVDQESQLRVTTIDAERSIIGLDASTAVPGAWTVTFHGADKACTGELDVAPAG